MLKTINPATGESLETYETFTNEEVDVIISKNAQQQDEWRLKTFDERAEVVHAIADELLDRKEELAELMADEMGKPLSQGIGEIEKCAWVCNFYADKAADYLAHQLRLL